MLQESTTTKDRKNQIELFNILSLQLLPVSRYFSCIFRRYIFSAADVIALLFICFVCLPSDEKESVKQEEELIFSLMLLLFFHLTAL